MPPLPDDDPGKWVYQEHTRAKHEVLAYYLIPWIRIVGDTRYTIRMFDCFAGRGDYAASDGAEPIELNSIESNADYPGSPLLMLDRLSGNDDQFGKAECYFVEPNDSNRQALEDALDSCSGISGNVDYSVIGAEFQDIPDIITSNGGWGGFSFFFMDPFGLKALDYDTVAQVASTSRFDCLITLMTKELIRWQNSEGHQESFETLYGTPDWRDELSRRESQHLETAEAEYYCQRLEEGGVEFTLAYMTTRGDSIELMYDLVFTTNDDKGLEAMKESMTRCGSDFSLAYAPKRPDIGGPEQTTLSGGQIMTEEKRAKAYLVSRFAGREMSFDEVLAEVFSDPERRYAESLRQDYRQYLKDLDNEGLTNIPERASEDSPLRGDYFIQFPQMEDS